jgi:hypothetical protein
LKRSFPLGPGLIAVGTRGVCVNETLSASLADLNSKEPERQNAAFVALQTAASEPVDWAYDAWDELLALLKKGDNRQRAIASQVLCSLAKSDREQRIIKDLPTLIAVTKDERFVTARHCMQSLWKIGVAGESQREALVKALKKRFKDCAPEKNCTLIRYDILESLRRVYDTVNDESVRAAATALIETEPDAKYKKKYQTLWRKQG